MAKELGVPEAQENERPLPGDELLQDAPAQLTHGITIAAPPERIWPWLVQIGCRRAGFYAIDLLDNAGVSSARELHPELAQGIADERARAPGKAWASVSWLFLVEPLGEKRCRLISRYRADCSQDLATRLAFGPALVEPVGFAMDRRMLRGVKERAERARLGSSNARSG